MKKMMKQGFIAEGTTCESCAEIIKRQALKVPGVHSVTFDYATETGEVTFDPKKTDIDTILSKIEEKGYECFILADEPPRDEPVAGTAGSAISFKRSEGKRSTGKPSTPSGSGSSSAVGWVFGLIGVLLVGYFLLSFVEGIRLPQISQNMGYGLLFVVGLLTGFHCIAMCGGFVVGYTTKAVQEGKSVHRSHALYAIGKTISYTVIGAAFGLLGSIIAFTPTLRGVAGALAGLFLILFGLKMLNVFPALRKLQFHTPRFLKRFFGKETQKHTSPLVIGLLNGLMIACGPLQAIYVMAAGTGSMLEGAKLLFIFGIGTLPVMLGFGYVTSILSRTATAKILKASGVIVIVLGILMLNNGLVLTGSGLDFGAMAASVSAIGTAGTTTGSVIAPAGSVAQLKDGYQEIRMTVDHSGWTPDTFVLEKNVPVRWVIDGKELNGCNSGIQVPAYGLNFKLMPGEQTIEFTPTESGTVRWSCWMGMIPGTFLVQESLSDATAVQTALDTAPPAPATGSCSMGGGCGCGRRA